MNSHFYCGRRAFASLRSSASGHALFAAFLTTSVLTAAAVRPANAQNATDLPPVTVDVYGEAGVSGPGAASMGEGDIASKRAATSDTAKMLKGLPGVSLYSAGGVSSLPVINGMADDRIKTLIDGMPAAAACPNHMNPTLSYADPNAVSAIDVYAGLSPVSAGGDSIAGTINVKKADPDFAAPGDLLTRGVVSANYRSNNHNVSLSGRATAATDNVSVTYNGSYSRAGDYHRGGDGQPVMISRFQVKNHELTAAARRDDHLVVVEAGKQSIPYEGFPNQRMDLTGNTSTYVNGRYTGAFGWGALEAKAYVRRTDHEMNFIDQFKGTDMPMLTKSKDDGYILSAEIPMSGGDLLRIGNEFNRFTLDDWWPPVSGSMMMGPNTFININNGTRDRLGTYAEWEARWDDRLSSVVGVRNDTVWMNAGEVQAYGTGMMHATDVAAANAFNAADRKKRDVNFDFSASVRFEADTSSIYEAGLSRKTRSPNLHERYTWGQGNMAMKMNNWFGDGNGYVGDIDLKPEVAYTAKISADWHDPARKSWGLKVTPFYTIAKNYIDADRMTGQTATNAFINLQLANYNARLYGADASGEMEVWETDGFGRGVVKASASLTRGRNTDLNDNLYNIMPLSGRVSLEQSLGGWTGAAEVEGARAKTMVSQTRNEISTPGYALLHLRGQYEWQSVTLNAGVENVFDKRYHEPLGGADMADTGSGWGYNVFGVGRTYIVGAAVRF